MSLSVFNAADATPERAALVCDAVRLTFAELALRVQARIEQLAALRLLPARADPIALLVDQSLTMFECLYALFALGVPVVPVNPRLTAPERAVLLDVSRAQVLLEPAELPPITPATAWPAARPAIAEQRALALVASSGSTGTPKVVELSRRAFQALARADASRVPPRPEDRALLCLPLSHVGGLSLVIRALSARRCCVVFRAGAGLLGSVPELAQALIEERVTLLSLVPPVLARLLRQEPRIADLAPLRALLLGGQACPAELFDEARALRIPLLTSYGLTEMCSQVTTLAFPTPRVTPLKHGVVGAGFPLEGVQLRIVNELIEVRGPTLFTGYVGQPAALDASGFFATGDRGEFDPELGLFVFGRASELVISGGENIDPTEVEHALLACGGVEAACVFGVPDPEFGERLAVALELTPAHPFNERALFAALDQRLASFKQPRLLCFFEQLPRLASGKLDRSKIRTAAPPRLRPADRASSPAR
ncbi:MAG: class I adenylate-forming enzyme family protein [Polyangiaceae bacterium]